MNKAKPSSDALPPEVVPDTSDIPEITNWAGAVRGKFYRPDVRHQLPIYLDADVDLFVRERAAKKQMDATALVNQLLRSDIALIQHVE